MKRKRLAIWLAVAVSAVLFWQLSKPRVRYTGAVSALHYRGVSKDGDSVLFLFGNAHGFAVEFRPDFYEVKRTPDADWETNMIARSEFKKVRGGGTKEFQVLVPTNTFRWRLWLERNNLAPIVSPEMDGLKPVPLF